MGSFDDLDELLLNVQKFKGKGHKLTRTPTSWRTRLVWKKRQSWKELGEPMVTWDGGSAVGSSRASGKGFVLGKRLGPEPKVPQPIVVGQGNQHSLTLFKPNGSLAVP
ncbi:uncharacterized protein M6B38_329295 [Iris pallida]|uniref:Uncharacterized protein n=1 Tax=Iris pallida TaxID=29817 RepID=A0AAX6H5X8_IRIPA|nr:uncharacterized protein M6B38_329295 [Iris pallida]